MLSKGLLNYSFYKLFNSLYNNYKSFKTKQKTLKHISPIYYNVQKNDKFRK